MSEITTIKAVAAALDKSEYPLRIAAEIIKSAKNSGIVIAFGSSDDLCELEGAIYDELPAYHNSEFKIFHGGLLPAFDQLLEIGDESDIEQYFRNKKQSSSVKIICNSDNMNFRYETDIPHEVFDVMEDGKIYCRGIVFNLPKLKQPDAIETERDDLMLIVKDLTSLMVRMMHHENNHRKILELIAASKSYLSRKKLMPSPLRSKV